MIAERILMGLLLGGVAIGCVWVLLPFWSSLLWAAILVFTTWPLFSWFRHHLNLRRGWAAALMVALTAVVLVLPIAVAVPNSASDAATLRKMVMDWLHAGLPDAPQWVFEIPLIGPTIGDLLNRWSADISQALEALRPYYGIVVEGSFNLLVGIANGVLMFLLALFIAFFFYFYGDNIAARLRLILERIAGPRADRLIRVTGATVRGVVFGILGTAVVQGFLTAFGLWISSVPRPVLLGTIAGLLAVLPVGAPLVWIPAAIWLMTSGHLGWGIFLAIYGTGVISGADSLIRPWFIARGAQLPFLLTILGVLGGAIAFGFLGIFLGPVLLGIGFTLMNEWATAGVVPTAATPTMPSTAPSRIRADTTDVP
ncbi:AI-2E family transporter [Rhodopila sp.]|jgi:predicted PurR-regulated permease PerM|uniref:AI-2E family transporter n=1 Tax=Rhodopila sp. TaxID=2480087 RepID=UPI002BEEF4A9|nr:AI-2E family transporter [Rhodopila sp.]HVZ10446.1 AI-2E family transporter [Rhodopila sp.]